MSARHIVVFNLRFLEKHSGEKLHRFPHKFRHTSKIYERKIYQNSSLTVTVWALLSYSYFIFLKLRRSESYHILPKLYDYLKVFNVWEGNPNGDDRPGVVIGEVQPFAHLSSADSDQQSTVWNKESHDVWVHAMNMRFTCISTPKHHGWITVSVLAEPHLFLRSVWLRRSRSEAAHQSHLSHRREAPSSQFSAVLASPTNLCCSSDLAVCPTSN